MIHRAYLQRPLGVLAILAVLAVVLAVVSVQDGNEAEAGSNPDSATLSLVAKPDEAIEVLVKDTFTVSVHMDQISMLDRDGDNQGGYTGWQARVNFPQDELKLVGEPSFTWPDADAATTAFSLGDGTVLLGSTVGVDANGDLNQESVFTGNLVDLTFTCNKPSKTHTITLKNTADTFVLAEPNPGPPPVSKTASVSLGTATLNVNCKAASMSLSLKEGSHFQDPNTGAYHVKVGTQFTVNVNVDAIRNLPDKDEPPDGGGYTAVYAHVFYNNSFVLPQSSASVTVPGCITSFTPDSGQPIAMNCTAFDAAQSGESQFEGKVFEVVFICLAQGKSNFSLSAGTRLVDENTVDVNVATSGISIRCVGGAEDKDGDGCSHEQELANGTNTNKYDFWDTNKNSTIDVQDFLNYLLKFGQPADAGPPSANKVNDTDGNGVINIIDILNVVTQFGLSCP